MQKSNLLALPILLLFSISVVPANAQTFANKQSTTCTGNNNSGCTTSISGRIVTPIRTVVRVIKAQAPVRMMIPSRLHR
jgi:hypothetical protein